MSALRPDADHSCAQSDYNLMSAIGEGDGKIKTSKKVWEAKWQIYIFMVLEYLSYIYKLWLQGNYWGWFLFEAVNLERTTSTSSWTLGPRWPRQVTVNWRKKFREKPVSSFQVLTSLSSLLWKSRRSPPSVRPTRPSEYRGLASMEAGAWPQDPRRPAQCHPRQQGGPEGRWRGGERGGGLGHGAAGAGGGGGGVDTHLGLDRGGRGRGGEGSGLAHLGQGGVHDEGGDGEEWLDHSTASAKRTSTSSESVPVLNKVVLPIKVLY